MKAVSASACQWVCVKNVSAGEEDGNNPSTISQQSMEGDISEGVDIGGKAHCRASLVKDIGDGIYTAVREAIRPIPGVNGVQWGEKARAIVRLTLLPGNFDEENILDLVNIALSSVVPVEKTVVRKILLLVAPPIAKKICKLSKCCE